MLTLIALSAVLLQDPPAPRAPRETFTRVLVVGTDGVDPLDRDGDGQVSREEFAAPMNDHFARIDADGDGRLSKEELSAGDGPSGEGNVIVFPGGEEDGSGVRRFELRRPGPGGDPRGADGFVIHAPPGGPVVVHGGPGGRARFEIRQAGAGEMDRDGDGRISEAEFTAPVRDAFAGMDSDRSGFLEAGEQGPERDVRVFTRRLERPD